MIDKPIHDKEKDIMEIPYTTHEQEPDEDITGIYCPCCGEDTISLGQNGWAECSNVDCELYIQIKGNNQKKINQLLAWAKLGEQQEEKDKKE